MPPKKRLRKDGESEGDENKEEGENHYSDDDEEEPLVTKKKTVKRASQKSDSQNSQTKKKVTTKKSSQSSSNSQKKSSGSGSQIGSSNSRSQAKKGDEDQEGEEETPAVISSQQFAAQFDAPSSNRAQSQSQSHDGPSNGKKDTRVRLMITKMILENFKSYAGPQEIGPFHKSFSSVVGPNGSGKSNVIDALLFVFGKRAKQLRHNKVSELIHHSDKFPNLAYCKVSVFFQDIVDLEGDAFDVVEGTEFSISRVGNANNSSKYYINDKSAKWEEVEKILDSKGIDLTHNRFLILQGEVEQIAMMKPKALTPHEEGLLEYLEDIIGTNKYVPSIEQKNKEVEEANDARGEKLNRLKITEKERENLEAAKLEAEECLMQEREIIDKRSILYQIFRSDAETKTAEVTEKRGGIEQKLTDERNKASESIQSLQEMETEVKKCRRENEHILSQLAETKSEFATYERKHVKFREDVKHLKTKDKKLEESIKLEKKKAREKTQTISEHEQDIKKAEKTVEELGESKEKEEQVLEEIYASLKDETVEMQANLEKKQKELMPWNKKLNEQQSSFDIAKQALDIANDKRMTAQRRLEELKTLIKSLTEAKPSKERAIVEANKAITENKEKLVRAKDEFNELSSQEAQLAEKVRDLRTRLEESKAKQRDDSSRNAVLDGLMDAHKAGKLAGIHGRLGNLGSINSRYDIAISTACTALNNIVVDTTVNAEKCVDYLRTHKLGVATFIILEKIEYLEKNIQAEFVAPKDSERLFDLVKRKNDKFATAFYYALSDTLVAANMDLATKIAFGSKERRYRVVTLEGQLIDTSGTMSGGGNRPSSGGMKATLTSEISPEELAALEKEFNENSEKLQALRLRKTQLDREMEDLRAQVSRLEIEVPKMKMDVQSVKTREGELSSQIPQVEEDAKVSPEEAKRIRELEKQVSEQSGELDKIKKVTSKLEEEVQGMQKQIMDVGGIRLKVQKAKVESLTERIDMTNSNITKWQVQIKSLQKTVKKSEATATSNEAELEEVRENLAKTRTELEACEAEAAKVMESYNKVQETSNSKDEALKELESQLDKKKKVAEKFRSLEVDLQNQIEEINRLIKETQDKEQHWAKKITDLNKQKKNTKIEEDDEEEPLPVLTTEDLAQHSEKELKNEIAVLEESLSKLKPNMNAIREYRRKEKDYNEKLKELESATEKRDELRKEYEGLRKKRLDEFMAGFSEITLKLKEMYQMITLGGDAELELVNSLDPFSEGIVFSVRPPKKSWKNISNLSGGEKTLSSLALVFALHHYKPTPLYVMDEIDAALDFKNVSIVAHYIKERTKNAQFIIISLRNYMFELADYLVGIFKTRNCSRSVTINPFTFAIPQGASQGEKIAEKRIDKSGKEEEENVAPSGSRKRPLPRE